MICSFLFAAITFLFAAFTFLFAAFTFLFAAIVFCLQRFFFFAASPLWAIVQTALKIEEQSVLTNRLTKSPIGWCRN